MAISPISLDSCVQSRHDNRKESSEVSAKWSNWLIAILLFSIVLITTPVYVYFSTFTGPLGDQDLFAKFGDFVGGTVNPLLGFITIALLILSIGIQREELRLTREELRATKDEAELSRKALQGQVEHLEKEAKLNKLSEMISSLDKKYTLLLSKNVSDFNSIPHFLTHLTQVKCNDLIERSINGEVIASEDIENFHTYLKSTEVPKLLKLQWLALGQVLSQSCLLMMRYERLVNDPQLSGIYFEDIYMKMLKLEGFVTNPEHQGFMEEISEYLERHT